MATISFPTELTVIAQPVVPEDVLAQLTIGIEKQFTILYKPFGGNQLFYYNQDLVPILDVMALYNARTVIFTNQARLSNDNLYGITLFNQQIPVFGTPSQRNWLKLVYRGGLYTFRDEYSLLFWSRNASELAVVEAHLV